MTIEEILDMSADKLKAMSDAELTGYFRPYFNITRPELAPKIHRGTTEPRLIQDPRVRMNVQTLAGLGIDVSHILKMKKR